jgi:hypothetical protein
VRAPVKDTLYNKIEEICTKKKLNIAWIDELHVPDKKWMVDVIATLDPENEIFNKDYVAPPIRRRLKDIQTIVLPTEIFEGLPQTQRKVKARRMKITSEAFAAEKSDGGAAVGRFQGAVHRASGGVSGLVSEGGHEEERRMGAGE